MNTSFQDLRFAFRQLLKNLRIHRSPGTDAGAPLRGESLSLSLPIQRFNYFNAFNEP